MQIFLAIDAGGTRTRAAVITTSGDCLAVGMGGSGNPVAVGATTALASVLDAARNAVAHAASPAHNFSTALVAMAGATAELPAERIAAVLAPLGLAGSAVIAPDLLATYFSGSIRPDGFALVAGTGSIAARVSASELERISGGAGWLLGDAGGGFWIGQRVVRAVVGALDSIAPTTALTSLLLNELEISSPSDVHRGRPRQLTELVETLYALRPVDLARFAPLAFAARGDAVAEDILRAAAFELTAILGAIRPPDSHGPVVLGGGLLRTGSPLLAALADALGSAELITVPDGLLGAGVLGLQELGVAIDERLFQRLGQQMADRRQ